MEVIVTRKYENDFKYDESEPNYYTEEIKLDSATFDEMREKLLEKRGKMISVCKLIAHVHDNAVGKVTTSGDGKFVPQLIVGELGISIQCHYNLYSYRIDRLGVGGTEERKDEPMTQDEWRAILGKKGAHGEDYPFDVYFDVCVYKKSDRHMLIRPCQMTLRSLQLRLTTLFKLHKITD